MRGVITGLALSLVASSALAQSPFEGGGPPGGMRGMMADPKMIDTMFDFVSKGKGYITKSDLDLLPARYRDQAQFMFDLTLQQMNITNGQLSKDQFKTAVEQGAAQMRAMRSGGPGGGPSPEARDKFLEDRFRALDKNGDGLLQVDEMPEALRAEREKWDTNKDGFIDLAEYKAYAASRFGDRSNQQAGNGPGGQNSADQPVAATMTFEPEPDPRPIVFRAGKLPKGLPAWFSQLDTDQDGQVGLYEWVKEGRAINEFREMDLNDDGFLTAEEVLRHLRLKTSPGSPLVSNGSAEPNATQPGKPADSGQPNNGGQGSGDGRRGNWGGGNWGNGGWGGGRRGGGGGDRGQQQPRGR
ncbi:MAG: hypothetical protein ACJ8C4_16625 [Gemmataceae bacterium]